MVGHRRKKQSEDPERLEDAFDSIDRPLIRNRDDDDAVRLDRQCHFRKHGIGMLHMLQHFAAENTIEGCDRSMSGKRFGITENKLCTRTEPSSGFLQKKRAEIQPDTRASMHLLKNVAGSDAYFEHTMLGMNIEKTQDAPYALPLNESDDGIRGRMILLRIVVMSHLLIPFRKFLFTHRCGNIGHE